MFSIVLLENLKKLENLQINCQDVAKEIRSLSFG
jgi:hypothetical protein